MKKVFLIFAAIFMLAFSTVAQTMVIVNDTSMGYIERYPVWVEVITDSTVSSVDTVTYYDTLGVTYDTIDTVVYPHYVVDTLTAIDTTYEYTYERDTIENYYDYRAFAYEGYRFDRWEIITVYNRWITPHTEYDSVWTDVQVFFNIDTIDGEVYDAEGWLMVDSGIPDIQPEDSSEITSITVMAYFEADPELSINDVEEKCFNVYPNPTKSVFTVDGDFDYLMIYNTEGKRIYRGTYSCFDLQRCPKGTYFIVIVADGTQKTVPIIKL